jgi:hypothetical protein
MRAVAGLVLFAVLYGVADAAPKKRDSRCCAVLARRPDPMRRWHGADEAQAAAPLRVTRSACHAARGPWLQSDVMKENTECSRMLAFLLLGRLALSTTDLPSTCVRDLE